MRVMRNTYLSIAGVLADRVAQDPTMLELPSSAEAMAEFGVSRAVTLRAFNHLVEQGVARRVPGRRCLVLRPDVPPAEAPLVERLLTVFEVEGLQFGDDFISEKELCQRFGVSRPTVRRALDTLTWRGVLSAGGQGKRRTVLVGGKGGRGLDGKMTGERKLHLLRGGAAEMDGCSRCKELMDAFKDPNTANPAPCLYNLGTHQLYDHNAQPNPRSDCAECAKFQMPARGVRVDIWAAWGRQHFMMCTLAPDWMDARQQ